MLKKKAVPSMVKDEQLIQKRREQMIKGAVQLFIDKGFHRTTTREIAKHSGFSIGTLYEYIGSKEDILYLVCDSIYEEVCDRLQQYLSTEHSGVERLKRAIHSYFKVIDEMQDEVLVMYQEAKSLPRETLPYVLQKEIDMTTMIESIIKDCVDQSLLQLTEKEVKLVAHNIIVQGQMWTFRRWVLQRLYRIDEYADMQVENLLKGID